MHVQCKYAAILTPEMATPKLHPYLKNNVIGASPHLSLIQENRCTYVLMYVCMYLSVYVAIRRSHAHHAIVHVQAS